MLYILKTPYFLCDYILDGLADRDDCVVLPHARLPKTAYPKSMMKVRKYLATYHDCGDAAEFFDSAYVASLQQIAATDRVLFFGVENLKDLLLLKKILPTGDISVFLWNPVCTICRNFWSRRNYARALHENELKVYTFDSGDAAKYGFHCIDQPYRYDFDGTAKDAAYDLFFVGQEKSRTKELLRLKHLAEEAQLTYKFLIQPDKHSSNSPELRPFYIERGISYAENLNLAKRANCVVELLQPGQAGSTIRTVESAFLGIKLITNNPLIEKSPFYKAANVLILDPHTTASQLHAFMQRPYEPLCPELLAQYRIDNWINQFSN